jgi:hypothetical protein
MNGKLFWSPEVSAYTDQFCVKMNHDVSRRILKAGKPIENEQEESGQQMMVHANGRRLTLHVEADLALYNRLMHRFFESILSDGPGKRLRQRATQHRKYKLSFHVQSWGLTRI